MPDLGILLGALISSVTHARRIADEESAAIAEYYKDNPLLSGMSIPRVRVPEVSIEVPMLIEAQVEGEADQIAENSVIKKAVSNELNDSLSREGISITKKDAGSFEKDFVRRLKNVSVPGVNRLPREAVIRAAEEAYSKTVRDKIVRDADPAVADRIVSDLRKKANNSALKKAGRSPQLGVSMLTTEVKEKSSQANVTRLKLTLKEEGLEWSVGENEDGTISRKLTPE